MGWVRIMTISRETETESRTGTETHTQTCTQTHSHKHLDNTDSYESLTSCLHTHRVNFRVTITNDHRETSGRYEVRTFELDCFCSHLDIELMQFVQITEFVVRHQPAAKIRLQFLFSLGVIKQACSIFVSSCSRNSRGSSGGTSSCLIDGTRVLVRGMWDADHVPKPPLMG